MGRNKYLMVLSFAIVFIVLSCTSQENKKSNQELTPEKELAQLRAEYQAKKDSAGGHYFNIDYELKAQEIKRKIKKKKIDWKDWPLDSFVGKPFIPNDHRIRKVFLGRILRVSNYFSFPGRIEYAYQTIDAFSNDQMAYVGEIFHHVFTIWKKG